MKPSYEELEAKCAALAAENSGLKCALNKIAFTYPLSPHIHEMTTIKTPATDAFLAEVRAQGVEMLTSKLQSLIDEGNFEGDEIGVIAGAVYTGADIAAQIRKGVQS